MKRRNFLTNTSLVLAGFSVPLGLSATSVSTAVLDANQQELLAAFHLTLTDYPGPSELKASLGTVATVEYADATTVRFRSLAGAHIEVRRVDDYVVTRLLA